MVADGAYVAGVVPFEEPDEPEVPVPAAVADGWLAIVPAFWLLSFGEPTWTPVEAAASPETLDGRPDGVPVGTTMVVPEAVITPADEAAEDAVEPAAEDTADVEDLAAALEELLLEAGQERS